MLTSAVPVRKEDNINKTLIYHFPTPATEQEEKEQKYKRNGDVKLTHSNAVVGVSTKTYAIKNEQVLGKYIRYYADRRHFSISEMQKYVLVMFELCTGLRVSDCICRTWGDIMQNESVYRDFIRVRQKKTSKYGEFFINDLLRRVLNDYKEMLKKRYGTFSLDWYLFPSERTSCGYITRQTAWNWCGCGAKAVGIELSVGNHGLRKTFGYTSMQTHKDDATFLAVLMRIFGHSSERITLAYCGIDEDDNRELYGDVSDAYSRALYY